MSIWETVQLAAFGAFVAFLALATILPLFTNRKGGRR